MWLLVLFLVDLDDLPTAAFAHSDHAIHSSAASLKEALTVLRDLEQIARFRLKGDVVSFVDAVHVVTILQIYLNANSFLFYSIAQSRHHLKIVKTQSALRRVSTTTAVRIALQTR